MRREQPRDEDFAVVVHFFRARRWRSRLRRARPDHGLLLEDPRVGPLELRERSCDERMNFYMTVSTRYSRRTDSQGATHPRMGTKLIELFGLPAITRSL